MPLKIQFHNIFVICLNRDALVRDMWTGEDWFIPLRRDSHGNLISEWDELLELLNSVHLDSKREDEINWVIDKTPNFTTKSLYMCLTHGGVKDKLNDLIWNSKMPLKVKIFMCQVFHKKLQIATDLKKRGWRGSPLCCVCGKPENIDHILFGCVFTQYICCCIRDAFGLQGFPISVQNILTQCLPRRLGVPKKLSFVSLQVWLGRFGRIETKWLLKSLFHLIHMQ